MTGEKLEEVWHYCHQKVDGHQDAALLLGRGIEMVEILSTLEYGSRQSARSAAFPLAEAEILGEEEIKQSLWFRYLAAGQRCDGYGCYPSAESHP